MMNKLLSSSKWEILIPTNKFGEYFDTNPIKSNIEIPMDIKDQIESMTKDLIIHSIGKPKSNGDPMDLMEMEIHVNRFFNDQTLNYKTPVIRVELHPGMRKICCVINVACFENTNINTLKIEEEQKCVDLNQ